MWLLFATFCCAIVMWFFKVAIKLKSWNWSKFWTELHWHFNRLGKPAATCGDVKVGFAVVSRRVNYASIIGGAVARVRCRSHTFRLRSCSRIRESGSKIFSNLWIPHPSKQPKFSNVCTSAMTFIKTPGAAESKMFLFKIPAPAKISGSTITSEWHMTMLTLVRKHVSIISFCLSTTGITKEI